MNFFIIPMGIFLAGALSWALTGYFLSFAIYRGIMDVPNERSLHSTPTPRAGGVSFVLIFVCAVLTLRLLDLLSAREVLGLTCGILVAAVGYWDDQVGLTPAFRIVVHFAAAILAVGCLRPLPSFGFASGLLPWPLFALLVVGALVWLTNLTNFMDGIDGLTSIEAITTAAFCGMMMTHRTGLSGLAVLFFAFAAAVAGFLVWNWPPAKIYMGDAGSGFLGFTIGLMSYIAICQKQMTLWQPLILYGVFVIDATLTLCTRILAGERWYAAHRTHAFQHAALRWGHQRVTLAVAAINVFWLGPFSLLADRWPSRGLLFVASAWTPLVIGALWLRAGKLPYAGDRS